MHTTLRRRIVLLGLVAAPLVATPALAQSPTQEGTTIHNTATASYTDANGNSYTSVSASADVVVGLQAALTVTSPASVTPASPSTGLTNIAFTISNTGNAIKDTVQVAMAVNGNITITSYALTVNGAVVGSYATLAALNTALTTNGINYASTAVVTLTYNVAAGQGGATLPVQLTATSQRDNTKSSNSTTNVIPPVSAVINTTPDNQAVSRLPSNGTQYTEAFVVQNNGNASDVIALAGSHTGANITIVSVNGTAGSSSSVTIAAGGQATVNVVYTIANGAAAGASEDLVLTATSGNDNTKSNAGSYVVTVVRSAVTIAKVAYRDNQTTTINATTDRVVPGEYIQYLVTVTNTGGAAASTVSVSDNLPAELAYDSSAGDAAGWTINNAGQAVTATLSGTLAASGSRFFWIRVRVR